jgi:hypothetical protein
MFWIALVILIIFLHQIGKLKSVAAIIYYAVFLGLGLFFLYLGYDSYHASLTALPANQYPDKLFVDYFSKEAYIKEANNRYSIGFCVILATFILPKMFRKEAV